MTNQTPIADLTGFVREAAEVIVAKCELTTEVLEYLGNYRLYGRDMYQFAFKRDGVLMYRDVEIAIHSTCMSSRMVRKVWTPRRKHQLPRNRGTEIAYREQAPAIPYQQVPCGGTCTVTALMTATGKSQQEIRALMRPLAGGKGERANKALSTEQWPQVMADLGFAPKVETRPSGKGRYGMYLRSGSVPSKGTFVMGVNAPGGKHWTVVKDGVLHDSWNCAGRGKTPVRYYYQLKT